MRKAVVATILTLFAAAALVGSPEGMITNGLFNGRFWRAAGDVAKVSYMQGIVAALSRVKFRSLNGPCDAESDRVLKAYMLPQGAVADAEEGVDRFYEEPENLLIPIIDALEIVSAKARGVPQVVIDERILHYRSVARTAPERR
jgi:hypothetical protein